MSEAVYDEHVDTYLEFIDRALAAEPSLFRLVLDVFDRLLGGRVQGSRVIDLGCGEGYLARHVASAGAAEVTGIDLSARLLDVARDRTDASAVNFVLDDARELATVRDASVDIAVSQMALMDIADHVATFRSVRRVLRHDGAFVFSLLHPCFESPFVPPAEPHFLVDDSGTPVANLVRRYAQEGHWREEGAGIRGHVGSHHRMLSTYVNDLLDTGFQIARVEEPLLPDAGLFSQVPRVMVIAAERADR